MLRIWLFVLLLSFFGQGLFSQEFESFTPIVLKGVLKLENSTKPLAGARIFALSKNDTLGLAQSDSLGYMEMFLPYDKDLLIFYSFQGTASKSLMVDTRNIPDKLKNEGFELNIDISLPEIIKGVDYQLLQEPIGLVLFDKNTDNFSFDNPYTRKKIKQYLSFKSKMLEAIEAN
ncbi:MAG: hypothetical protein ACPF8V_01050 [Luteibaculum sp.]